MSERIQFHLDEHMDPDIAVALRRYGVDIATTQEVGLRTEDDAAQLAYVPAERPIIITDDSDFLRIAGQTLDHPGIAFCRRSAHSLDDIIRFPLLLYEMLEPDEMIGRVEYL